MFSSARILCGKLRKALAQLPNLPRALALASAAQALKHTMPGDFLSATRAEIEAAVETNEGGVLQR